MSTLDLFRHDFVLSIKPEYAVPIVEGRKTVELRRVFPFGTVTRAKLFVYATVPVQAVIGYATISEVERLEVPRIWECYQDVACISRSDFNSYYEGRQFGFVIHLIEPVKLPEPVPLAVLKKSFNFTPPQSFAYAEDAFRNLVVSQQ